MLPRPISIAIASSQQLLLDALAHSFDGKNDFETVLRHTDFLQEPVAFRQVQPDVTLIDVDRELAQVVEFSQRLRSNQLGGKIVFLVGPLSDWIVEQLLSVRPDGCILKSETFDALYRYVVRIVNDELIFSAGIEERLTYVSSIKKYKLRDVPPLSDLTRDQIQIFRRLAKGERVKDIAEKLQLSYKSVDSHKYRVMQKIGIHDRVALAHYAIREGLISPQNSDNNERPESPGASNFNLRRE